MSNKKPNVVYVFGDQWRAQSLGYAGDPDVKTPHLDRLASQSVNCTHAVAGIPVCTPARATLISGQRPLSHGIFLNDVCLGDDAVSLAQAFGHGGYDTAYIGKWHIDGHGRSNYIPPERRQGFDYWKVLECTHNYNDSPYYAGASDTKLQWPEYDALAQTRDACDYIDGRQDDSPFLLVLSWGPPHNPYETAPEEFRNLYDPEKIHLRPNVPQAQAAKAREWIAGYNAHCSALDSYVGMLLDTLDKKGIADDTIFVFTSDHGDMLGSQGLERKQKPWDESIRVPFLLRYPARFGTQGREIPALIDAPDMMPTLLGLCGLEKPDTAEGLDFSDCFAGGDDPSGGEALIACYHPFGEWYRQVGGREFRGLRTVRHTYVRTLEGPWLLYDNEADPYQMDNLAGKTEHAALQADLDARLLQRLKDSGDEFLSGTDYVSRWGYEVNERGTVEYIN
jgi:arylsulfatase A-like enzyme